MFDQPIDIASTKVYVLFAVIIFLLIWRFWKSNSFEFKVLSKLSELLTANSDSKSELKNLKSETDQLNNQLETLARRSADFSSAIQRLSQDVARLSDTLRGDQAMTKAIEMARKGESHDAILNETNLTPEEVEAIIHSHGQK